MDNEPNIANIWLVFDKDREPTDILKKIRKDAKNYGYNIAFSNPCIEIWFLYYLNINKEFGESKNLPASQQCINELKKHIKNYCKNDIEIYKKLITIGNEEEAIKLAQNQYYPYKKKPLEEWGCCSNVFSLVEKLKN